jgi:hypothetical protein
MKKQNKKFIGFLLLSIIGLYLLYKIITGISNLHLGSWDKPDHYMWVFKNSIVNDINEDPRYSFYTRRDVYNNYHYKDTINIIVWEFKEFVNLELNDIVFYQNSNLADVKFSSGQTINKDSDLEITMKYRFSFDNELNIYLDANSEIQKEIKANNYKGFYGSINKMLFTNDQKSKPQIFFDYVDGSQSSLFLFYKHSTNFYLILINALGPLDESIIDILNLQ